MGDPIETTSNDDQGEGGPTKKSAFGAMPFL